jgi:hypothetical protein
MTAPTSHEPDHWEKERAVREAEHQLKMREIIARNLATYEEAIYSYADPREALSLIFRQAQDKLRLAQTKISVDTDPALMLQALADTEKWYTDRGLPYPQPAWLKEQTAYWQNKLASSIPAASR